VRGQRVLAPSGPASWTVIGVDRRPVEPVESYLAWLSDIERSPNTVRAYALDLKTYWSFLEASELAWDRVTLEQLGRLTAWLRQPVGNVILLSGARPARSSRTVNRMLTAVFGFYEYHARNGVEVAKALVDTARSGRGSYKPFLHGIAATKPRGRVGRLREERRLPVLSATLGGDGGGV
jgi:integrase/recombinase XerD